MACTQRLRRYLKFFFKYTFITAILITVSKIINPKKESEYEIMLESIKPKNKRSKSTSWFQNPDNYKNPIIKVNKTIQLVEFIFKNMNMPINLTTLENHGCFCNLTDTLAIEKSVVPLDSIDLACYDLLRHCDGWESYTVEFDIDSNSHDCVHDRGSCIRNSCKHDLRKTFILAVRLMDVENFEPNTTGICPDKDETVITVENEVCCEIPKSEVVEVKNRPIISGAKRALFFQHLHQHILNEAMTRN